MPSSLGISLTTYRYLGCIGGLPANVVVSSCSQPRHLLPQRAPAPSQSKASSPPCDTHQLLQARPYAVGAHREHSALSQQHYLPLALRLERSTLPHRRPCALHHARRCPPGQARYHHRLVFLNLDRAPQRHRYGIKLSFRAGHFRKGCREPKREIQRRAVEAVPAFRASPRRAATREERLLPRNEGLSMGEGGLHACIHAFEGCVVV